MEISTPKGSDAQQHFSINLNNVVLESVGSLIIDKVAGVIELGGSKTIESWVLGKVYDEKNPNGVYQRGGALSALHPKTPELMGGPYNGYFERSKPQYETLTSNHFISVKTAAKGCLYEPTPFPSVQFLADCFQAMASQTTLWHFNSLSLSVRGLVGQFGFQQDLTLLPTQSMYVLPQATLLHLLTDYSSRLDSR